MQEIDISAYVQELVEIVFNTILSFPNFKAVDSETKNRCAHVFDKFDMVYPTQLDNSISNLLRDEKLAGSYRESILDFISSSLDRKNSRHQKLDNTLDKSDNSLSLFLSINHSEGQIRIHALSKLHSIFKDDSATNSDRKFATSSLHQRLSDEDEAVSKKATEVLITILHNNHSKKNFLNVVNLKDVLEQLILNLNNTKYSDGKLVLRNAKL